MESLCGKGIILDLKSGEARVYDPALRDRFGRVLVPDRADAEHGVRFAIPDDGPHKGKIIFYLRPDDAPVARAKWNCSFLPFMHKRDRDIDITDYQPLAMSMDESVVVVEEKKESPPAPAPIPVVAAKVAPVLSIAPSPRKKNKSAY